MEAGDLRELLEQVRAGDLGIDSALAKLGSPPVVDLGFAQIDLHRRERCGFPEVIFCEGKTAAWVEEVVRKLREAGQDSLATRVSAAQADALAQHFPEAQQD